MSAKEEIITYEPDPLDFLTELFSDKKNIPILTGVVIKGVRDKNLKNDFYNAVYNISKQGKKKILNLSEDDKYELFDDVKDIIDEIEDGIDIKKYRILKKLFLDVLSYENTDIIYLRKIKNLFLEFTYDEVLTLGAIYQGKAEPDRLDGAQDKYIIKLAELTGLKQPEFIHVAIQRLKEKFIVKEDYMRKDNHPLTSLGDDMSKYLSDE